MDIFSFSLLSFQRPLANATFAGPRAAGGSGGTSRAATNPSSKTGSPGSMVAANELTGETPLVMFVSFVVPFCPR
ncbi:hypothetical protein N7505_001343 [Penicillium chrysogenum]|uniref:Uncharacterized protein n=1 Tax=Penicillium chrysogenum TaxID=5076 RepID=A0ABQ8WWE2_PENCH|nr:hypothetical protein N7505_001343 [Penicillium chrysogenum]